MGGANKIMRAARAVPAIVFLAAAVYAEAPNLFTYQGRLKEGGQAVSGSRTVEIKLCPVESGGACETTGAQPVAVSNGLFRSTFTIPAAVNFGTGNWWLEIKVGADTLIPRERLTSNAYSLFSATAAYAENIAAAAGSDGVYISSNLYVTGGKYYGDGSQLQNLPVSGGAVAKTGDAMTGQLTLYGSSLTVGGSAFSVGGAAFRVESGRIGIGTVAPSGIMEINGTDNPQLLLTDTSGDVTFAMRMSAAGPIRHVLGVPYYNDRVVLTNKNAPFPSQPDSSLILWDSGVTTLQMGTGGYLSFVAGTATEKARLTPQGNFGLGTTAPLYRLVVSSAAGEAGNILVISTGTSDVIRLTGAGEIYANYYHGDGSSLTGVTATGIADGSVTSAKIADSNVTDAKIASMSASKLTGALPAIDGSALTSVSASIADGAVTLAKMANIATASVLGRNTAGPGVPEVLSAATVKTILSLTKSDVGLASVTDEAQIAKTIGTSKGDIIAFSAAGTPASLAVGADGTVFMADSAQAVGVKWAALTKNDIGLGNVDNVQQMPMSYLDTDNTLAADSDSKVASQKAIKAFVTTGLSGKLSATGDGSALQNIITSTAAIVNALGAKYDAANFVAGTNYLTPSGDGSALTGISGVSPEGSALTSANIWVGNASNLAAAATMSGEGSLANTGAFTLSKAITPTWTGAHIFSAAVTANGTFTLGDNGDTGAVNTSDWDISTTGAMTGISGITTDGAYTQSGTGANAFTGASTFSGAFTLGDNGDTGSVNTSDWDISATGAMTGITGITNNGAYTQSGTNANTFTGAVTASNAAGVSTAKVKLLDNVELSSTTAAYYGGVYASTHVYVNGNIYGEGSGLTGVITSTAAIDNALAGKVGLSGDEAIAGLKVFTATVSVNHSVLVKGNYSLMLSTNVGYGGGLRHDQNGNETMVMAVRNASSKIYLATGYDVAPNAGGTLALPASPEITVFNGMVGIKDTTPNSALDVTGQVNATGGLCINDNCKTSWLSVDNLGDHTATQALNMADRPINSISTASLNGIIIASGTGNNYFAGSVGIGIASPTDKLNVLGGNVVLEKTSGDMLLSVKTGASTNAAEMRLGSNNLAWSIGHSGDASSHKLSFQYYNGAWSTPAVLTTDGKFGIGTNSPVNPLEVNGVIKSLSGGFSFPDGTTMTTAAGTSTGYASSTDVAIAADSDANASGVISFATAGTERMRVDNGGYVGIGVVSPAEALDVNGSIKAVDSIYTGAGSVALPAYSFSEDTNTGIYNSAADQLSFVTAGTSRMTMDSVGNVGLGLAAPGARLDVQAAAADPSVQVWRDSDGTIVASMTATGLMAARGVKQGVQELSLSGAQTTFAADGSGVVLITQTSDTNVIGTITGCNSGVVAQGQQVLFIVSSYVSGNLTFADNSVSAMAADKMVLGGSWEIALGTDAGSTIVLACTTINSVKAWVEVSRLQGPG